MKLSIDNYPGSKSGSGIPQFIINHIPECSQFIEGFGGSAAITFELAKHPIGADLTIFEISAEVSTQLIKKSYEVEKETYKWIGVIGFDCVDIMIQNSLLAYDFSSTVFYFDPPYLMDSRRSQRKLYHKEWTVDDHKRFFYCCELLEKAGAKILISHYDCKLYNDQFKDWHTATMQTMTHAGTAEEKIYMNYDIAQLKLLCTAFVGSDYMERQRINRKKKALVSKLKKLPMHERQAVLYYLADQFPDLA